VQYKRMIIPVLLGLVLAAGAMADIPGAAAVQGAMQITATPLAIPPTVTQTPVVAEGESAVLVGSGDIASCVLNGDEATAALLDEILAEADESATEAVVFTTGDNAYESGTAEEFLNCYDPSWGRFRERTRPTPGNHDYVTTGASAYFEYFGDNAGDRGVGYYSYALGAWHIVVLNSLLAIGETSAQAAWLRENLAANPSTCTLAYWHHPRFNSGRYGNDTRYQEVWEILYENGVDIVLNGHEHVYERFAPQDPYGNPDPVRGIRQFTIGTGGASLRRFESVAENSEVRDGSTWGVLKLTLSPSAYEWEFIPVTEDGFRDQGTGACVP
jgi:acid phosphatase type 7